MSSAAERVKNSCIISADAKASEISHHVFGCGVVSLIDQWEVVFAHSLLDLQ